MKTGLIGKKAKVVSSPNSFEKDINGIIKRETKNALIIGNKLILKNKREFLIDNQNIKGDKIIGKFQERTK